MTSTPHRAYLLRMTLVAVGLLATVVSFNLIVDVYQAFGTQAWTGVNLVRHGMDRHERIAKAYAVRRFEPQAVLLGTSRGESALDPEHPMFSGKRTYNLALTGSSVYELYRYLQHATGLGELRQAVVAVDFFQFTQAGQWVSDDFSEGRLSVAADGSANPFPWQDLILLALGGGAAKDSWWSMTHRKSKASLYRADGFRDDSRDIPDMLQRHGGQHYEFVNSEAGYVRAYRFGRLALNATKPVMRDPYDDVRLMLAWANAHQIDLILLVPPVHARHLELIYRLGAWQAFEDWRRRLVSIVADSKKPQCLWDFSGYGEITAEPLPDSPQQMMRWWRESSHASSAAGRRMLDAIAVPGSVPGFGHCLTPANVDSVLADMRRQQAAWAADNPADVEEILATIRRVENKH